MIITSSVSVLSSVPRPSSGELLVGMESIQSGFFFRLHIRNKSYNTRNSMDMTCLRKELSIPEQLDFVA
jgi:hypothetical protein